MISINRYILMAITILGMIFMASCSHETNTEVLGNSVIVTDTLSDTTSISEDTTTLTTVTTITTTATTTTLTSMEPSDYKTSIQNAIVEYESMLMELNTIVQNYSGLSTWDTDLQDCLDTSNKWLDFMNQLQDTNAVPKMYQNSHEKITSCMVDYTKAIELIQKAIESYLEDDITSGDDYMNQALNHSQIANKGWESIRGYGIVEYSGETLEPQTVVSEEYYSSNIITYEDDEETYIIPESTTSQTTFKQDIDGYSFGDDNVFIYTN